MIDADDTPVHPSQASVDRLWDLILEQRESCRRLIPSDRTDHARLETPAHAAAFTDERLMHLEREHTRLLGTLEQNGIVLPAPAPPDRDEQVHGIPGVQVNKAALGRNGSLRWKDFKDKSGDGDDASLVSAQVCPTRTDRDPGLTLIDTLPTQTKVARRASALFPSSLASLANSSVPPAPLTSDSATFQDSFTPTTASAAYAFDSPLAHTTSGDRGQSQLQPLQQHAHKPSYIQPPPLTRLLSGTSILGSSASPTGTTPPAGPPHQSQSQAQSQSLSASTTKANSLAPISASAPNPSPSSSSAQPSGSASTSSSSGPSEKDRSHAKDAARSAAKSFRVTLEDPCWKVLPAALKKYKINDDWKMYALFICFDNTGE